MIRCAWVLNLGAERELQNATYTPSKQILTHSARAVASLQGLLFEQDVMVECGTTLPRGVFEGRAWCPTPRAQALLQRAGARIRPAPDLSVLRQVNHRQFCADLGQTLPGALYVRTDDELRAAVARTAPNGHWLLKRPLGFAGKGRRRVAEGALEPSAEDFVRSSFAAGDGLQVEPWVTVLRDVALHGYLTQEGALTLGETTEQQTDAHGVWEASCRALSLSAHAQQSLRQATEQTAAALHHAGYFGPFGVDGYFYTSDEGTRFNARSEINARYSMGWAIGMGERRPDRTDT